MYDNTTHPEIATPDALQCAEGEVNNTLPARQCQHTAEAGAASNRRRNLAEEHGRLYGVSARTILRDAAWVTRMGHHPDILKAVSNGNLSYRDSVREMDTREGVVKDRADILSVRITRLRRQLAAAVAEFEALGGCR